MSFTPPAKAFSQLFRPAPDAQSGHPPAFYYSLLWLWGQVLPPSALTLRLFSWLVYWLVAW